VATLDDVREVAPGLHFAGSLEVLRRIAEHPPGAMRLLLGYAGWGPGQLENELAEGAWLLAPAEGHVVFDVPCDEMWTHVVRSLGVEPATLVASRAFTSPRVGWAGRLNSPRRRADVRAWASRSHRSGSGEFARRRGLGEDLARLAECFEDQGALGVVLVDASGLRRSSRSTAAKRCTTRWAISAT
jgi:hypothetical protein